MSREFAASARRAALVPALAVGIVALSVAACGVKGPLKPAQPPAAATGAPPSETPAARPAQPVERKP
jgi:predicted small lipoprotein YifL